MMSLRDFIDNWTAIGLFALFMSLAMVFAAYVSQPPKALNHIAGKVIAIDGTRPSKSPKLNIFISGDHETVRVYTDFGKLSLTPGVGDAVEAEYEDDTLGRNFHRFWDLRRGNDVLMSKSDSMASALAECRQLLWSSLGCFSLGGLVIGARLYFLARAAHAP